MDLKILSKSAETLNRSAVTVKRAHTHIYSHTQYCLVSPTFQSQSRLGRSSEIKLLRTVVAVGLLPSIIQPAVSKHWRMSKHRDYSKTQFNVIVTWSYIQIICCSKFPHLTTYTCWKTTPPQASHHLCILPGKMVQTEDPMHTIYNKIWHTKTQSISIYLYQNMMNYEYWQNIKITVTFLHL